MICGPGSSVGIATGYGLEGLGSNPDGGEIFRSCPDRHGAHPAPCIMGTVSFPEVEGGQGVTPTPHTLLVPRSGKQSRAVPLLSIRAFVACI
jgi:hypothetical protein